MLCVDFTGDFTSSPWIQIDDRNFGSLLDEKLADILADISASPGNDGDLVLESHRSSKIISFRCIADGELKFQIAAAALTSALISQTLSAKLESSRQTRAASVRD